MPAHARTHTHEHGCGSGWPHVLCTCPVRFGVSATDTELQEWRTQTFTQWDSAWGQQLTEAQIRIIVEIKESFRGTDPESGDLETGRVLTKLEEFGVLEQYCRRHGLPMEKATALIRRAANGR